ncbi:MAG TPA: hypothetical protein VGU01_01985 [Sphingomicrobium sp.]|nr:hypothetical protein [Sphingomicrobium sp.]
MSAFSKLLVLASAAGSICVSAPAAAQYYPGYGYGQPDGTDVVGQILSDVLGGPYGYRNNSQIVINQCASAAQARLGGYAYGGYAGARVLGISGVSPRGDGGITVRGVATSGRSAYGGSGPVDLTWLCRVDPRGFVRDVAINRVEPGYGYNRTDTPWNDDYSRYGYRRY